MTNSFEIDILIVGAGPTGLMLALQLARQGINFRIIDKKSSTSEIIKATALSSIALESFDDLNYAKPFTEIGNPIHALEIYAESQRIAHTPWLGIESKYPYFFLIGQNYVEKFQEQLLNKLGKKVEWGGKLIDFTEQDSQVTAVLQHNGQNETLACKYLIGCDGSHSIIRKKGGFITKGKKYPSHYIIADVNIEGNFSRKDWYFFLSKNGFASVGGLPEDRWGILVSLPNDISYSKYEQPTLEELQKYFDKLSEIPGKLSDPRWISHFHTYLNSVNNRKKNRLILCGDAAHQVSPLTSLGMNLGLLDANNLAWKLALVSQGYAAPNILDTYSNEQNQILKPVKILSNANEMTFSMTGFFSREYRDHMTNMMMKLEPVIKYFGGMLSQTTVRIGKSFLNDEFIGMPIHMPSSPHLSNHSSCLRAWTAFGKGPSSGERAPNVFGIANRINGDMQWLFDNTLEGKFALFIFNCCGRDKKISEKITNILQRTQDTYGKWIKIFLINKEMITPEALPVNVSVLYDVNLATHERFGAEGECLYLIRPDRFVGFRSIPPRWDKFSKHLKKIFTR